MKFKILMLACVILGFINIAQADSKLTQALTYAQQNPARIAQITAGGLSFATGSIIDVLLISYLSDSKSYLISGVAFATSSCVAYSGYHTLNDALNNKPNNLLKNLIQKAKAQYKNLK